LALVGGLALAGVAALVWDARAPVAVVTPTSAAVAQLPAPAVATAPPSATVAPAPRVSVAAVALPPPVAKPEPRTPPQPPIAATINAKPASSAPAAAAVAPLLSELPIDIRSQIPALAISGSVYSDNPSQRLLLVNGQVLPQGSQVAPDVTLVEIHRGGSEFTFRGTRFRLAH
jgi:general secretion pathway protein B